MWFWWKFNILGPVHTETSLGVSAQICYPFGRPKTIIFDTGSQSGKISKRRFCVSVFTSNTHLFWNCQCVPFERLLRISAPPEWSSGAVLRSGRPEWSSGAVVRVLRRAVPFHQTPHVLRSWSPSFGSFMKDALVDPSRPWPKLPTIHCSFFFVWVFWSWEPWLG